MKNLNTKIYLAWLISLIASVGSLFFSEVMGFVPCSLCWYQRIFMYPVAILLTIGIFQGDQASARYAFPLALIGWLFAFYHNLLMWGIIPESASPCRMGIPCTARYIDYLGFITIPFLALIAFTLIVLLIFQKKEKT